jgi:hypothetical protein
MKITIDSTEVAERSGTSAQGKPYRIRTQTVYADLGKRYPSEVRIRLKDDAPAYAKGDYDIDLSHSVYVSKYGSLALSEELVLTPAKPAAARAA